MFQIESSAAQPLSMASAWQSAFLAASERHESWRLSLLRLDQVLRPAQTYLSIEFEPNPVQDEILQKLQQDATWETTHSSPAAAMAASRWIP